MDPMHPPYGAVKDPQELGSLLRAHRRSRALNLETVSAIGGFSTRFLSEFERGKETAEIGKVLAALGVLGLEMSVAPRRVAPPTGERSDG